DLPRRANEDPRVGSERQAAGQQRAPVPDEERVVASTQIARELSLDAPEEGRREVGGGAERNDAGRGERLGGLGRPPVGEVDEAPHAGFTPRLKAMTAPRVSSTSASKPAAAIWAASHR